MRIEEEIKQNKFRNGNQKAIINLLYTVNWLQNLQQEIFKPFGITAQQFNILRILRGQYPNAISATEIKSRMIDKNSDVSRLLDRLIQKNLIVKKVCPVDKRAADILITNAGLDILKSLDAEEKKLDGLLALTEDEANQLSDLLDKARSQES